MPKTALLTEVFDKFYGPGRVGGSAETQKEKRPLFEIDSDDLRTRGLVLSRLNAEVASWISRLPDDEAETFYGAITASADACIKEYPDEPTELVQARHRVLLQEQMYARMVGRLAAEKEAAENSSKKELTKTAIGTNVAGGVKNQWPALKRRLQKATAEAGLKSKLADFLRVDLTRVSQWLTDAKSAREPGAEYALQMLHWVERLDLEK